MEVSLQHLYILVSNAQKNALLCKSAFFFFFWSALKGGILNVPFSGAHLGDSCADIVCRFAFICSIILLTFSLTSGSCIPRWSERETQVPSDLLCQQYCKLGRLASPTPPSLAPISLLLLPSTFVYFIYTPYRFPPPPPPPPSHALVFWIYFTLNLCYPGHFFRKQGTLAFD